MNSRTVDSEITLVPYYPNEAVALPWYQDAELCRQVDNRAEPYTLERLRATLKDDGEIAIVVCADFQNRGIGRRCVREMVALAREDGMREVRANIYAFNARSQRVFQANGFERTDEEWYRLCL